MIVLYLLVTGVAAGYCLLAIWAATGRGHWFARACVLLGALALLVPIRAFEPLILFGMTSALLVALWCVRKRVQALRLKKNASTEQTHHPSPASSYRFRLADLLLACGVAAAASWMFSVLVARGISVHWWHYLLAATALASVSSLAVIILSYWHWWWLWGLLPLHVAGAVALDRFVLGNWMYADELLQTYRDPAFSSWLGLGNLAWLYGEFALWSLALALCANAWHWKDARPVASFGMRAVLCLAALPLVIFTAAIYWRMLGSAQPPAVDATRENVLPKVMELAERLENASPRQAAAIYDDALPLLKRPGFIAIDWQHLDPETWYAPNVVPLISRRGLARQLKAESGVLHGAGKHDEAADYSLAIIRFGAMVEREGLLIDALVGEAIHGIGHAALARDRDQLTSAKVADTARVMETIAASREPPEAILERERLWNDLAMTWRHRLEVAMYDFFGQEGPEAPTARAFLEVRDRGNS